jgi:hypothetical protein
MTNNANVNPFTLPSDEEVFRMRDDIKKKKEEERERNAKLKIHEKITNSSKRGNIRRLNFEGTVRTLLWGDTIEYLAHYFYVVTRHRRRGTSVE